MGIVVTIIMLAGLVWLAWPERVPQRFTSTIAFLLVAGGGWNVLWYGAAHFAEFWGQAALVSGASMLASAWLLIRPQPTTKAAKAIKRFVQLLLAACFLLYSITLVQLNLGLPIIR